MRSCLKGKKRTLRRYIKPYFDEIVKVINGAFLKTSFFILLKSRVSSRSAEKKDAFSFNASFCSIETVDVRN